MLANASSMRDSSFPVMCGGERYSRDIMALLDRHTPPGSAGPRRTEAEHATSLPRRRDSPCPSHSV